MRAFLIGLLGFALAGCNMLNKPGGGGGNSGGGGGGGGGGGNGGGQSPGGKGWAETVADAPLYKLGQPIEAKAPPCSGNGFIKLEVEKDKPFYVTTKSSQMGNSCASIEILNGMSQAANTPGASADICPDAPKTIQSKGQEGGTYIVVQERYGCAGITVSITTGEGTAPAGPAATPEPASGPTPEN